MHRVAISVVIVTTLLACPFICMGQGARTTSVSPAKCCCPRCQSLPDADGDELPAAPSKGSGSCLCCGATLSASPVVAAADCAAWVADFDAAIVDSLMQVQQDRCAEAIGSRVTSGRLLRLEHCALRC